jgi:hypothetical protein
MSWLNQVDDMKWSARDAKPPTKHQKHHINNIFDTKSQNDSPATKPTSAVLYTTVRVMVARLCQTTQLSL